jgi:hypothetical protein
LGASGRSFKRDLHMDRGKEPSAPNSNVTTDAYLPPSLNFTSLPLDIDKTESWKYGCTAT